jgi:hypothetical protein
MRESSRTAATAERSEGNAAAQTKPQDMRAVVARGAIASL